MLFQSLPFEKRALFWYRNVRDFSMDLTAQVLQTPDGEKLLEGLQCFRQLLMDIYSDTAAYHMEDDLDSYHRMMETVLLLFVAAAHGMLMQNGEISCLRLEKAQIRKHFKRPAAFHLNALENYGFYYEYEKGGKTVKDYTASSTVTIYNDNCAYLLPALAYFAHHIPPVDNKKDYAMQTDLFCMADYDSVLLKKGIRREEIDPLRPEILRTIGENADDWIALIKPFVEQKGLGVKCKFWSYCVPCWVIHITQKRKTVCIFTLCAGNIFFEWSAPYEAMVRLAQDKEQLIPVIREKMERFGCIRCGVCKGENITMVNGISLCTKETWARRITYDVSKKEHIQGILWLACHAIQ